MRTEASTPPRLLLRPCCAAEPWPPHVGAADSGTRAELVVVSPLTRTLRTATIALGAEQPALPFVANPDIQETFPLPCDTGSPVSAVAPLFPHVDFTGVPEDYFDAGKTDAEGYRLADHPSGWKMSDYRVGDPISDEINDIVRGGTALRCRKFVEWLQGRPETRIIVVAHKNVYEELLGYATRRRSMHQRARIDLPRPLRLR